MKVSPNGPCPCGGAKFKTCCRPFHRCAPAPTPEALMRSRYSAYAAGEVSYIMATTDPLGPHHRSDADAWAGEVEAFCASTVFEQLTVLSAEADGDAGTVSFRAQLSQDGRDASFSERSTFRRVDGRWLYTAGERL